MPSNLSRLEAVDALQLVGPGEAVRRHLPLEAADMRDALRFGEPRLAARELLERRLAIGDVDRQADASGDRSLRIAQRLDQDVVGPAVVDVLKRATLARERLKMVRHGRVPRIVRADEVVHCRADEAFGVEASAREGVVPGRA